MNKGRGRWLKIRLISKIEGPKVVVVMNREGRGLKMDRSQIFIEAPKVVV